MSWDRAAKEGPGGQHIPLQVAGGEDHETQGLLLDLPSILDPAFPGRQHHEDYRGQQGERNQDEQPEAQALQGGDSPLFRGI